jgi:hypothetical protein
MYASKPLETRSFIPAGLQRADLSTLFVSELVTRDVLFARLGVGTASKFEWR